MAASQYFDPANPSNWLAYYSVSDGPNDMSFVGSTLATWVRFTSFSAFPIIMAFGDSTANANQISIWSSNSGQLRGSVSGSASQTNFTGSIMSLDTWYFVAFTSIASDNYKIYLNGLEDGSTTASKTFSGNPDRWAVGRMAFQGSFGQFLNGNLCYPHVYDRALSISEINEIMNKPYSITEDLVWAPNMLTNSPSSVSDFKDLSGNGFTCNQGEIPTPDLSDGPPVYFPELETV